MHPHSTLGLDEPPEIDVALLAGPGSQGVTPMALYRDKDEVDQKAAIVGFGEVGDGKSKLRGLPMGLAVRSRTWWPRQTRFALCSALSSRRRVPSSKACSRPGDGGAPALIRKDDAWLVAGLVHRTRKDRRVNTGR